MKLFKLLVIVLIAAGVAMGQNGAVIQFQNAGTPIGTFAGWTPINCSTNMTCVMTGGVVTMTASSTASAAFSTLTASTNSNAGTFSASGNTWDFHSATAFLLPGSLSTGFIRVTTTTGVLSSAEISGDCTSALFVLTCLKTNGTAFGTFATQNYATPPAIGGTTPAAASFTALTLTTPLSLANGGLGSGAYTIQGTDGKLLTSGTISGTLAAVLCLDAQSGATTTGCPTTPLGTAAQVPVMNSGATAYVAQTISGDSTMTAAGVMTNTGINGTAVPTSAKVLGTDGSAKPIAAALTSAHIYVGNGSNLPADVALSGDSTITSAGLMTNTAINGTAFPTSASVVGSNGSAQPVAATAHGIQAPQVCAGSGTGSAQTCSTSISFVAAAPDCILFTPSTNNSGDVTIAANGGSAFHVYKWANSSTLTSGDMVVGVTEQTCLDINGHWQWPTVGNAPASGATINNQNQFGAPYYSVAGSNNTLSGVAPPATQGYFNNQWVNTTNAATAPQPSQVGLGRRAITGSATNCGSPTTVAYSDVDGWIDHDQAASGTVNCHLPTPTTLNNTAFAFRFTNHSAQSDTITPDGGFTIQVGSSAAASTLTVASGNGCAIAVDPNSSTNWLADCSTASGSSGITGTLGLPVIATASTTGGSQAEFVNAAVQAGASYCDKVSAAFTQAVAVGAAVVDARALQGNFTCTAAQAQGMFPNPIPWTLATESNPAVGGMTLLMGQTVLTIQSDKTNLGVPGLEIPSTVTIKGLSPTLSVIKADNTGCTTAAATTCTNWGVRYYTISAAADSGSGPGRFVTETIATGVTNTATGVCTAASNGISGVQVGVTSTRVVTVVCNAAHNLREVDLGRDIVIAGASSGCTASPNGTWPISGITNTTTFTFLQTNTGTADAGCGTGNTGTIHLYSIPREGEFLSSQATTTGTADDNYTAARVCGPATGPTLRGGCSNAPSNTSIEFYNAPYDGTTGVTTTNGGNLFLGTPLISLGPGVIQQSGLQSNMRHVVLQDVQVTCQNIPGCIAIQNVSSQEETHVDFTTVQASGFLGWDFHNGGSSGMGNSGPYTGNYILLQGSQFCNYTSTAAYMQDQFTREYNGMTINYDLCATGGGSFTGPPGNNNQPHWSTLIDGPNYSNVFTQWHVEGFDIGEQLGSQQPIVGITLEGMHGAHNLLECVDISNNFSGCTVPGGVCTTAGGTSDINIQRINHGSGLGCPVVIADNIPHNGITNNSITGGNNGVNAIYAWDAVSPSGTNPNALNLISTDGNLVNIFDGGVDIGHGGLLSFVGTSSGTASLTASSTGALNVTDPTGSVWNSATGGAKGAGTINAAGLYINGTSVGTGGTVTVVGAGTLTSTAFVTGGGTQTVQTPSATATLTSGGAPTFPGDATFSAAAAHSTSSVLISSPPDTGGSGTTTQPVLYLQSTGAAVTGFSTAGTGTAFNAPSGFTGNIFDSYINGGTNNAFTVSYGGGSTIPFVNMNARSGFTNSFLNFQINGGSTVFAVNYQGNVSISQTAASQFALNLTNTTAATSSVAQSSPFDIRTGQFWLNLFPAGGGFIAAASQADCWSHQVQETNGTNGSSIYTMLHNAAADGCQGSPSNSFLQAPFTASWGVQTNTLAQPSTPVITAGGTLTSGAHTWTYTIVACVGPTCTQPSAAGSFASSQTTLTTGAYTIITWSVTANADYYKVYRTASGGTPATLGIIAAIPSGSTAAGASCSASTCIVNDEALTGDTTAAQAFNSTGQVFVGTAPVVGGGSGGGMFSVQGTAPTVGASTASGWYANATDGNVHVVNGVVSGTTPNDWGYATGVVGKTLQKSETTTADANVLTVTPVALAGTYRLSVSISVSAATSGIIGWKATWTDSNGNAQTPAELELFQNGTAAPALTFTTSAAGNYHGTALIDVNNSATNIVIKWIGGGTTTAKMSAVIEKVM